MMRYIGLWLKVLVIGLVVMLGYLDNWRVPENRLASDLYFLAGPGVDSDLFVIKEDGSSLRNLTANLYLAEINLKVAPDRTSMLVLASTFTTTYREVYWFHPFSGAKKTLLQNKGSVDVAYSDISWSPDSQTIAYLVYNIDQDSTRLESLNLNTGLRTILFDPLESGSTSEPESPQWSPDGRWIYFNRYPENGRSLYRVRPNGSALSLVLASYGGAYWWSADGKWLFYNKVGGDDYGFYRISETQNQRLQEGNYLVIGVTPDWIYLWRGSIFYRMRPDGSNIAPLFNDVAKEILFTLDWVYLERKGAESNELFRLNLDNMEVESIWQDQTNYELLGISPNNEWLYLKLSSPQKPNSIYALRSNGTQLHQIILPTYYSFFAQDLAWVTPPTYPWHPLTLALGAVALGLSGFILRRKA
jgi:hypothetical protein